VSTEAEHVREMELDKVEVFLGRNFATGFYAWLIPKEEEKAKVGLAAKREDPERLLKNFMLKHPLASKKLRTAKILQPVYHPITLGGPTPKPYSDGFLAVGDAASQVKPTTGGGIIVGLTCASVAAEVAHEALEQGEFSAKFLSTYKERCDEKLGFDASFMLRMRKMFDALSDRQMDSAIGFCKRLRLEKVLQKMEDVDFQGRAFLHALGNPKTLAAFGYFLYLYFSANP
ncbi:MAG: NAD(P)/FAD-dependent oxidoreductase, partial [Candidatus Bathyarchaeia archaeon]